MPTAKMRGAIVGSEKKALPNAKVVSDVDPNQRIEVTVLLRSRTKGVNGALSMASQASGRRKYLNREEFTAKHGANPDDLAKVEAFAHQHHLTITETNMAARSVKLAGMMRDLTAAFRPNLKRAKIGSRIFRMRKGPISVPRELKDIIVAVLGFDDRPAATPHIRFLGDSSFKRGTKSNGKAIVPHNAADGSFTPLEVARLYNFPAGLDGTGQCIAIIELNDFDQNGHITGTGFRMSDLQAYFASLGLATPQITAVGVDGGANVPGPDPNADGEVMLDIEVAGAVAPKAKIAVYFAPNTDKGFIDAINAALHDNVRKPSVISISWGGSEDSWTGQTRNAFDLVLQDAASLGVSVCCSSGDDGSSDIRDPSERDGRPHVDFPAASSFALACGGTKLFGSGTTINSEDVWNEGDGATGGGVSNFFARPSYQSLSKVPKSPKGKIGRGVPDVAGDADPATGYQVRLVGGKRAVIGGTSAVSPLWAGLIARLNQRLVKLGKPRAGFLNPLIYKMSPAAHAFHDIVNGDNDIEGLHKYKAGAGWDACTGLGTPDGSKLLAALGG